MRLMISIPVLAGLCVSASAQVTSASEENWQVEKKWAECLIQHAEDYVAGNSDDPVVIYVQACPEPLAEKSVAMLMENSIVPEPKSGQGADIDAIVVFTRAELRCLAKMHLDSVGDIVSIPKQPQC